MATTYSGGIRDLNDENLIITDPTIDAAILITLDAYTTGIIDASSIKTLTGSDTDKATVRASSGIIGLANDGDYIVPDKTISASNLISLDSQYLGTVNASAVTTITGSAININTVYTAGFAGTITGLGNEAVNISDFTIDAALLMSLY